MSFLDKMEKKIGRHPVRGLMKYVIGCYVIGYILYYAYPHALSYLTLEPYLILHGQVWRIISWVLLPPSTSLIWALIMTVFYYQLGTALEHVWGAFKFNVFIFGGVILTIIGAFLLYFFRGTPVSIGATMTSYYLCLSIFLAFALMFPDQQVLLWFVIPVRMKWMALLYILIAGFSAFSSGWGARTAIIASVVNLLIFWALQGKTSPMSMEQLRRRREYQKQAARPQQQARKQAQEQPNAAPVTRHRCAVCGRTELDHPELEFRFCSKCNGNYEYCQDHLFSHRHVE